MSSGWCTSFYMRRARTGTSFQSCCCRGRCTFLQVAQDRRCRGGPLPREPAIAGARTVLDKTDSFESTSFFLEGLLCSERDVSSSCWWDFVCSLRSAFSSRRSCCELNLDAPNDCPVSWRNLCKKLKTRSHW